jgi:YVTN family beta-propeller protein
MKNTFLLLILAFSISKACAQKFELSKTIPVAGDGGWDYLAVDEVAQHLFVSHGNVVNVIDLKSDKTIATIPDTKGVHGIAIANDLNKAFITDGKDNAVTIINLTTFEFIEKVKIEGIKPDAVLYDQFSNKVFVYNAKSNDVTVLDATTNKIMKTIPLDGNPEFSVTNNKGLVYVNIEDKSLIQVIDTKTLKVVHTWNIAPGEEPTGLAFDTVNNRLFSVCANKLLIVTDAITGKIIKKLPIGDGSDGVAFDANKKLIFSSNGEGTLTIIKEDSKDAFSVLETVKTQKGARTIALNKTTGQLYMTTAEYGKTPEATKENPNPRPAIMPDSFRVLVMKQI